MRNNIARRTLGEYLGECLRYAVVHTNDQWQEDLRKKKLTLREKFEVASTYFPNPRLASPEEALSFEHPPVRCRCGARCGASARRWRTSRSSRRSASRTRRRSRGSTRSGRRSGCTWARSATRRGRKGERCAGDVVCGAMCLGDISAARLGAISAVRDVYLGGIWDAGGARGDRTRGGRGHRAQISARLAILQDPKEQAARVMRARVREVPSWVEMRLRRGAPARRCGARRSLGAARDTSTRGNRVAIVGQ